MTNCTKIVDPDHYKKGAFQTIDVVEDFLENESRLLTAKQKRKPFLRLGVVIRRFFCSKILGHKVDLGYTDSGYLVCKRCKMHEYYDANFDSPALFIIAKRVKWWIIEKYKRSRSNELPF